jgi:hypothetical protein
MSEKPEFRKIDGLVDQQHGLFSIPPDLWPQIIIIVLISLIPWAAFNSWQVSAVLGFSLLGTWAVLTMNGTWVLYSKFYKAPSFILAHLKFTSPLRKANDIDRQTAIKSASANKRQLPRFRRF